MDNLPAPPENKPDTPAVINIADDLAAYLTANFEPGTAQDADMFLTTAAITNKLQAFFPLYLSEQEMYGILKQNGFTYTDVGLMEPVWCIKRATYAGSEG